MPNPYTIKANEWISKLSKTWNHRDGGDKIWSKTPNLYTWTGGNRNVLQPGWVIEKPAPPPPVPQGGQVSQNNPYVVRPIPKKQLKLTFYEFKGGSHPSVEIKVYVGGFLVFEDSSFTGKIVIPFISKEGATIIDELTTVEATAVVQVKRRGVKHGAPHKIKLNIGALEPLTNQNGSVSVTGLQKILTNLGYAPGAIDGIYGPKSSAAIRAFQADFLLPVTNVPDRATCAKLLECIETTMRRPSTFPGAGDLVFPGYQDPDIKSAVGTTLPLGPTQYFEKDSLWDQYEAYIDRTAPPPVIQPDGTQTAPGGAGNYHILKGDETGLKMYDTTVAGNTLPDLAFGGIPTEFVHMFPLEVYVAPTEEGADPGNPNPIWMLKYRSVFLDCGGWIKDQHDFGIILGWHAYLCTYIPPAKRSGAGPTVNLPASGPQRMDHRFFTALGNGVKLTKCVSAVWGNKADFDWQNITIFIPDQHLMTGLTGNVWKPNSVDADGPFYDLRAEIDFFKFATEITHAQHLQHNVKIIQLGDTYDLWIGSPQILGHEAPLFAGNKSSSVILEAPQNLTFGQNQNYRDNKNDVVARWANCGIPNGFDGTNVDMRVQVLQWWVQAIQGVLNTPLEHTGVQNKPQDPANDNWPWVRWILTRRVAVNATRRARLTAISNDYYNNVINGRKVAETLADEFASEFERVPNRPTMKPGKLGGGMVSPFQPNIGDVNGWINAIQAELTQFQQSVTDYALYVGSDLNDEWLNPAEASLRMFAAMYPIQYLYGNHDNYLILASIQNGACDQRLRFIDGDGIFVEHAHRMEPGLMAPANANYDGNQSGFTLTNSVWRPRAEKSGIPGVVSKFGEGIKDALGEKADATVTTLSQVYYRREAGRWLVARTNMGGDIPYIFVIGHTHAPMLQVNYVELNDGSDFKGPGTGEWSDDGGI